jgi:RNA polymerase sigma-70 factor (ECF subfamily)
MQAARAAESTTCLAAGGRVAYFTSTLPMVDSSSKAMPRPAAPAAGIAEGTERLDLAMDRYGRGDDAAFDELYRLVAPRLRGFLIRLTGEVALAEDLAHEALLRVHRARGSFETGAAALPWIFAIARNVFLDHARHAQVMRAAGDSPAASAETQEREAPLDTKGDEALIASEMLDVVRRTLAKLPVLQREAFVLIRFEGMTVSEAAQVLGTTEGAVKVRAFRAYEALRAALGEDAPKPGERR